MAWMMMGRQPAFMATKFHVQSKAKNSKKAISCLVIVFVISLIIAPKTCRKRKQLFTARSLPVFCISPNARDIDISAVIKVMRNSTNVFIDMHFHKRNEVVKNAVFSWQSLMLSWEAGLATPLIYVNRFCRRGLSVVCRNKMRQNEEESSRNKSAPTFNYFSLQQIFCFAKNKFLSFLVFSGKTLGKSA